VTADLLLGVDVGGTGAKYVVADLAGAVRAEGDVPTDPASPETTLGRVARATGPVLDGGRLHGVGLACAGIVNPLTGWLGRSPNLPGWEDSNLFAAVDAVFGNVRRALANDVNGALYGEFRAGAGRGCADLVMIALGTGVGGGVLLGGELLVGTHFGAGEIGHMVMDPHGPVCTCGGRGCLEAYAGSVGLLRAAREAAAGDAGPGLRDLVAARGVALTTRDLARLAVAGDEDAAGIFTLAGRRLGQAVGNLINVLDPDRILIGGGVAQAGDLIFEPCRRTARAIVLAAEAKDTPILPAELGPLAAAVGAALLVTGEASGE